MPQPQPFFQPILAQEEYQQHCLGSVKAKQIVGQKEQGVVEKITGNKLEIKQYEKQNKGVFAAALEIISEQNYKQVKLSQKEY